MREVHNLNKYKRKRNYLRNNSTQAEKAMCNCIKNSKLGYKFRRQHGIENFIVDFYCPQLRLVMELDGEVHDYNAQKNKDYIKEKKLQDLKFKIIRYENFDVLFDIEKIIKDLKKECDEIYRNILI